MFAATFIEEAVFSTLYIQIILYESLLVNYAWMCFWAFCPLHGSTFLLSFQWYDFLWDKLKLVNVMLILFFSKIFCLLTVFHGTLWIILKECFSISMETLIGTLKGNYAICIFLLLVLRIQWQFFVYECLIIFHLFVSPLVSFISILQFFFYKIFIHCWYLLITILFF